MIDVGNNINLLATSNKTIFSQLYIGFMNLVDDISRDLFTRSKYSIGHVLYSNVYQTITAQFTLHLKLMSSERRLQCKSILYLFTGRLSA